MDVRELRTISGLTQLKLAKESGLDRTRLSLAEGGYVVLRPDEEANVRRVLLDHIESRAAQFRSVLSGKEAVAV
jgi:transcriptional regulator with XRE-family HTH domain